MGLGDELMALGEANALHEQGMPRIAIHDKRGKRREHPLWRPYPWIVGPRDHQDAYSIRNGSGCRPYIETITPERYVWKEYKPIPAPRPFVPTSRPTRAPYIVLEPTVKAGPDSNKDWGWEKWRWLLQDLRSAYPSYDFVQVGPAGTPHLHPAVIHVTTPTFESAMAVLGNARALVTTEGALHHAAAALRIPAVVLFGGFISPKVTGYAGQASIYQAAERLGCGSRRKCDHCRGAMERVTVYEVVQAVRVIMGPRPERC